MALIKCPECQKEVSDSALYCPACGKQLQKLKRSFFGRIIKWVFILFNIFMIYTLLVGIGGTSEIINNATSDAEKAAGQQVQDSHANFSFIKLMSANATQE